MSLVRDDWLYSEEGLARLRRALPGENLELRVDPSTNVLSLQVPDDQRYMDDEEDEYL